MATYITYGVEYLNKRLRAHHRRLGLGLSYVAKVVNIPADSNSHFEKT